MAQRDFIWWNDERILHLIELYRRKPVIWDPKHEDYYKKNLKLDAWEDIGRALGISGDDCKNKMVNVLSSWRRERGKENKKTDEVYKSHWFAYNALRFLKDREMPRKGLCKSVTLWSLWMMQTK
ncbi:uncharacterized protein LOC123318841 [Coccinella septempunctata]|uniref:uncharacterized protein LOC123318841 n=1 Tax=Coccinella septempunctata TaxID=41139 RepID=UPI001D086247|nr:uncharacterized protein LOC123318841 [Coccinella septempunctata]